MPCVLCGNQEHIKEIVEMKYICFFSRSFQRDYRNPSPRRTLIVLLLSVSLLTLLPSTIFAQVLTPEIYSQLDFRHIGPEGNRVIAIAGQPGNPQLIYAGAASGGIWKSTDGGLNWQPVFDDQNVSSIGALAVALTPMSYGQVPAKQIFEAASRLGMAFTSRSMAVNPGEEWGSRRPGESAA